MQRRISAGIVTVICLLASGAVSRVLAAEPAPAVESKGKFIRLERNKAGEPTSLQTAVVHYTSPDPKQAELAVDLIGAVHVGEKSYYEALNKLFDQYDVVLYELVAPEGTRVPKGAKPGGHPVAMMQNGLKDMLSLEHQLEFIDYSKKNMVHADMSPDDFAKSMDERGESVVGMVFRMMGHGIAQQSKLQAQGKSPEIDLLAVLFDKDRSGSMKRMMAEQFENVEGAMQALDGPQGSTIITERNKVALKKLAEEIAAGKKKIGIFYGAGHLSDMEKRLQADFHLNRASESWLTAWQLDKPVAKAAIKKAAEK